MKTFKADISRALSAMTREEYPERIHNEKSLRHLELHPSGFPFCPLKTFHKMATNGIMNHQWESCTFDYYVSVGTAVHTVMQKFFGRNFHVVGDWECKKCKNVKKFSTFEEAGSCCGYKRHYEELGVSFKKTIRGHTDGLFKYRGKYYVIDYKTSSIKSIDKHNESGGTVFPYKSNREQIRSYIPLLEREYNIKIEGWALIYLARDNPFSQHCVVTEDFTDELRSTYRKRLSEYDKQYSRMLLVTDFDDHMEYLLNTKPCQTEADYQSLFASEYGDCPLKSICLGNGKGLRTEFKKVIRGSKWLPLSDQRITEGVPAKPEKQAWQPSGTWQPPKIDEF